ncbi:hypothetical protein [Lysobacter sp. FW306-1B-D06B]|uniref:hypothetical protein n=1 Tax=Lysobacter sp. FW306-1B-D06B TaxID=3140250 RepID=UPI0031404CF0
MGTIRLVLNHGKVRTANDLRAWAVRSFGAHMDLDGLTPQSADFLRELFNRIGRSGLSFVVVERFGFLRAPSVSAELDGSSGWRQALGFHLHRDYLNSVAFE